MRGTIDPIPELWLWAEYYCPWCYLMSVRLHGVGPEYEGRVRLRVRPFPLEIRRGEPAPRDILEQEWWLAGLQEVDAPPADSKPGTVSRWITWTWCTTPATPVQPNRTITSPWYISAAKAAALR